MVKTQAGVTKDLVEKHEHGRGSFKMAILVGGYLLLLGIVGVVLKIVDGFSDPSKWGYHVGLVVFLMSTAGAAPMVAIAPRMAKAHWRRPISRIGEIYGAVGVLTLILFIPVLWVLPGLDDNRRSLWFFNDIQMPATMPHIMATLSLVSLVALGLALLWLSALPDLAILRDRSTGSRQKMFARLANGWSGTSQQWFFQKHRMGVVGAFYFMTLVITFFFISVDFSMTLVPGWIDALYPLTQAQNALQAAAATVLVTMYVLHRWGGYREYITLTQFWGLGKLLFALSLLWIWFWFSSFIIFWYGAKPAEQAVLELLTVGPYLPIMYIEFALVFLIPLWVLVWNPVRKSVLGPTLIAIGVLAGTALDRIRVYVASYSVPGIGDPAVVKHELHAIPDAILPALSDILIWVGGIGGAAFIFLLVSRVIPVINIWEQKELVLYQIHKKFHRTEVQVLGKPD
ncbi:MAG: hypothetical protein FJ319_01290 [SAR202 cluster bacterium]|nr:hypothetical protein [SAR202 cluster bacterium]